MVEVECDSVAQVREALAAGAHFLLLDNMPLSSLREAVAVAREYYGVRLEASGGLRLANAREVAETGVDYLAVGALTHSSRALDLGLDYADEASGSASGVADEAGVAQVGRDVGRHRDQRAPSFGSRAGSTCPPGS